jgi:hypothetical protein
METMVDPVGQARHELEMALDELDAAQRRFQGAIGTSAEQSAYQRLRRATRRVAAAQRVPPRPTAARER